MKNQLTERHQNICIYGGIFGALISATCLIQLFAYTSNHWMAYILLMIYAVMLDAFLLLSLQRSYSPLLLIISSVLALASVAFIMISGFYSLILILQLLYCVAMTITIYMENVPALLKEKVRLQKEEKLAWRGKL